MATPAEFRSFCAHVDCGPGLYAVAGPTYVQIGSTANLRRLAQQPHRIVCVARIRPDMLGMLRRLLRIQGWPPDREGRVYASPRAVAGCMRLVHRLMRGRGFYTASNIRRVASTAPLRGLPTFRRVLDDIGAGSPLRGLPAFRRGDIGADSYGLPAFRRADVHGLPTFRRVLGLGSSVRYVRKQSTTTWGMM